jgi:hypothetical protein
MANEKIVYTFTDAERRVVGRAYQRYTEILITLAEIHELPDVVVAPDLSGFLSRDNAKVGSQ